MAVITETELFARFPDVPWREPIAVEVDSYAPGEPDAVALRRLGCRICIAQHGLPAYKVGTLPRNQTEFDKHMAARHAQQ